MAEGTKRTPAVTRDQAGQELKVGDVVTIRAKVVDVTGAGLLNCTLQVVGQNASGAGVGEAHAPRFHAAGAWTVKGEPKPTEKRATAGAGTSQGEKREA